MQLWKKEEALDRPYSFTERSFPVELTDSTDGYASLFASDLCVVTDEPVFAFRYYIRGGWLVLILQMGRLCTAKMPLSGYIRPVLPRL